MKPGDHSEAPPLERRRAPLPLITAFCLALASLPFELVAGLRLGPLTLTNVELLLLAALALWAAWLAMGRRRPAPPGWLALGAAVLVVALLLSGALAATERAGALKFALRQAQGALLALCIADTLRRGASPAPMATALLAGAGLSAALGLAELSEAPAVMAALSLFKSEGTYMGGLLRLSATFSYANTAAQYYEALLPLAALAPLALLARGPARQAEGSKRRFLWLFPLACLLPLLLLLAAIFTYSRAALLTLAALLLLTPLGAWRFFGPRAGRLAGAVCGALVVVALGIGLASPTVRLRVAEPEVANWFSARYFAPQLEPLAPNEVRSVPIAVLNDGRIPWDHQGLRPVRLAYHWIDAASGEVVRFEGRRTLLPHTVMPGSTVQLTATIQAPPRPGRYILLWDMLREYIGRGWFSQMGIPPGRVVVEVTGAAIPGIAPPPPERPATAASISPQPGPPGRGALWRVALAMWQERPLLGIGPDVFRHIYGPRLGLTLFDTRIHTNSLYFELLTGAGVIGLGTFLWLIGAALIEGWRALAAIRQPTADRQIGGIILLASLLGICAFLIHGLLDVFLAFTPTYGLLWALLGIVGGIAPRPAQ